MGRVTRRRLFLAAGALLGAPLARAQRRQPVPLGFLLNNLATLRTPYWQPLFSAFAKLGWREGADYFIEGRETRGDADRALAMARELVANRVSLLFTTSTGNALAAKRVTDTTPIVGWLGYPVEAGLVQSLARPGGNVTGVTNYASVEVWGKFIELLREIRPGLRELGVLWDYAAPAMPDGEVPLPAIEKLAKRLGINVQIWLIRRDPDLSTALAAIEQSPVEAIIVTNGGGIHIQPKAAERIGQVVVRRKLPAIVDSAAPFILEGATCVLAYSASVSELQARLAGIMDRLLRGANPAKVPIEQPSRFELVVNAKAARSIGIAIPSSLLLRADRVIE